MAMLNNQRGYLPSRTTYTENPSAVLAPLLARSMAVFMASWGSTTRISSAKFMAMPSWAQGFCDFFWPKTWFCLEEKDRKKWGSWFFFWDLHPGEKTGKKTFWGNGACLVKTWRLDVGDFRQPRLGDLGNEVGGPTSFCSSTQMGTVSQKSPTGSSCLKSWPFSLKLWF